MIIDLILDRKDGDPYNPKAFYNEVMEYSTIFDGIGDNITRAMDSGTDEDVRNALCEYITKNKYNQEICDYINTVRWIEEENNS